MNSCDTSYYITFQKYCYLTAPWSALSVFICLCLFFANLIAKRGVWCFILHLFDSEDNALSVSVFKFILFSSPDSCSLLSHALAIPQFEFASPAERVRDYRAPLCAGSKRSRSAGGWGRSVRVALRAVGVVCLPERQWEWSDHAPSSWHSKYS